MSDPRLEAIRGKHGDGHYAKILPNAGDDVAYLLALIDTLQRERDALKGYCHHRPGCSVGDVFLASAAQLVADHKGVKCTCGLDALLASPDQEP